MTESARALVPVPVVELTEEWAGIDPRHLSSDSLASVLKRVGSGSGLHMALLREQARRRELRRKIAAVGEQ